MTDFEQLSYASSPATAFSQGRSSQRRIPFPGQPGPLSTMPILFLKKEDRRNTRAKFFRSLHCSSVWLTDVKNLEVRLKDKLNSDEIIISDSFECRRYGDVDYAIKLVRRLPVQDSFSQSFLISWSTGQGNKFELNYWKESNLWGREYITDI